ncbi:MAG TPA: alpha/beta hydrolase, partial [Sphingomonas sp.]|nr:alpha/beta hydrolase [Sphingomonas sp.]
SQQGYEPVRVNDADLQQRAAALERDQLREAVEAAGAEIFGDAFLSAKPHEWGPYPLQHPQQQDRYDPGWALPEAAPPPPAAVRFRDLHGSVASSRHFPPLPGAVPSGDLHGIVASREAASPPPTASRNVHLSRAAPPEPVAPPAADIAPPAVSTYRVWYATNRAPAGTIEPSGTVPGFTGRRDPKNVTRYGACDVFVPQSHKFGSIGSGLFTRLRTWTDDRLKIVALIDRAEDAYWRGIRQQLADSSSAGKQAVVFLHGYNVSFEDAALRAAQIGFDLGIEAMAFFSWPSQGKLTLRGYTSDGNSIEASEAAIADFLVKFAEQVDADSIHVIAHSMGNRGLMRAVARISSEAERRSDRQFDNFVLAAADVDADTFRTFADEYAKLARRTTLYVSRKDKALMFAKFWSDYDRIGFWPPVAIFPQMDTISVSDVDLSIIGHGFVAELAPVLGDLHQLFTSNLPPAERIRLEEVNTDAGKYWKIRA